MRSSVRDWPEGAHWRARSSSDEVLHELREAASSLRESARGFNRASKRVNVGAAPDIWGAVSGRSRVERVGYFRFVDTRLAHLYRGQESSVSTEALETMKRALIRIGRDGSLFPHIDEDGDGGIVAEWVAAGDRIEIGVEADGSLYLLVAIGRRTVINNDFPGLSSSNPALRDEVSKALEQLTRRVNINNPNWRSLFSIS